MVGRARAASTRGCTSDGPGPMSVRTGGLKEVMFIKSLMSVWFCGRHSVAVYVQPNFSGNAYSDISFPRSAGEDSAGEYNRHSNQPPTIPPKPAGWARRQRHT